MYGVHVTYDGAVHFEVRENYSRGSEF